MIIMHDYPLRVVDHFAGFLKVLRPQFTMPRLNTIHDDCVLMFLSQKQKLSDIITKIPGGVNLANQHVLNGQLLMGECYANVLSSMAQEALEDEKLIKKVRDSIKFIKTNETCGDKFDGLKKLFSTDTAYKDLNVDNRTRWDTSYNMLLAGYEHRQLLSCLETCYPDYKISSISSQDWRKIDGLCSCLKVLFQAGNVLTRPKNLTANELYHEMIKLQLELSHAAMYEEDLDVRNLAKSLWERFDLYWRGCFLVLAIAVVMDPRCKMEIIKDNFTEMYGEEDAEKWIKTVNDAVHDLYISYGEQNLLDANIEVAQEPETGPQVEQTTESHQHEGEHKVEKKELGDDSQAQPQADEDYHMGDVLLQDGTTLVTIGD
ncbi:hypothetical protein IGI04_038586, partial [Brassica rapa subsp. trilocularis]